MNDVLAWEQERAQLNQKIQALRSQGICYTCHGEATAQTIRSALLAGSPD